VPIWKEVGPALFRVFLQLMRGLPQPIKQSVEAKLADVGLVQTITQSVEAKLEAGSTRE